MELEVVAKKNSASSSKMQHKTLSILITTLLENQTSANLVFSMKLCNFKGLSLCQLSKGKHFFAATSNLIIRKEKSQQFQQLLSSWM